jgi:hypothetical protein
MQIETGVAVGELQCVCQRYNSRQLALRVQLEHAPLALADGSNILQVTAKTQQNRSNTAAKPQRYV